MSSLRAVTTPKRRGPAKRQVWQEGALAHTLTQALALGADVEVSVTLADGTAGRLWCADGQLIDAALGRLAPRQAAEAVLAQAEAYAAAVVRPSVRRPRLDRGAFVERLEQLSGLARQQPLREDLSAALDRSAAASSPVKNPLEGRVPSFVVDPAKTRVLGSGHELAALAAAAHLPPAAALGSPLARYAAAPPAEPVGSPGRKARAQWLLAAAASVLLPLAYHTLERRTAIVVPPLEPHTDHSAVAAPPEGLAPAEGSAVRPAAEMVRFSISVDPEHATLTLDGHQQWTGQLLTEVVADDSEHQVRIVARGFVARDLQFTGQALPPERIVLDTASRGRALRRPRLTSRPSESQREQRVAQVRLVEPGF